MTRVNPELPDAGESHDSSAAEPRRANRGFVAGVKEMFGTSHRLVVNAVDDFLSLRPGEFDHHMLRIIAAAAPSFDDPNHVALMIRSLRPTQMNVTMLPIDLEDGRRQFRLAIASYRPQTARKLVLDLVNRSTREVLLNSPYERIPEAGREIIRDELRANLATRGELPALLPLANFVTPEMITSILDRVESEIEAVESGSNGGPPSRMELRGVAASLGHVLRQPASEHLDISDDQISRAWELFERCVPGPTPYKVTILDAASNRRLLARHGPSVLAAVDRYSDQQPDPRAERLRSRMLACPELAEAVARDAVRAGVRFDTALVIDRLALARFVHYQRSNELFTTFDSAELDSVVVDAIIYTAPNRHAVASLETEGALHRLASKAHRLSRDAFRALLDHPKLQPDHVSTILEHFPQDQFRWLYRSIDERVVMLLTHPTMKDGDLFDLLDRIRPSSRQRTELVLEAAVCNASAGHEVLGLVDGHCENVFVNSQERRALLLRIAANSASTHVHETLTARALGAGDTDLAAQLMRNGTLRIGTFENLAERFRDQVPLDVQTASEQPAAEETLPFWAKLGYTPMDVSAIVLTGEASPGRADALPPAELDAATRERLIGENWISDECLRRWTAHVDPHLALEIATHPRASTATSELTTIAAREARDTADAIEGGMALPGDRGLRKWGQLPNRDDLPLPATALHELIGRQVVDGHRLQMPKTRRDLVALSERMHNCLASYQDSVERGNTMIVYTETDDDIYAAAIDLDHFDTVAEPVVDVDSQTEVAEAAIDARSPTDNQPTARERPTLRVGEINSKFNTGRVPDSFREGIAGLVRRVNNGTLLVRPPRRRPLPADLSNGTEPGIRDHPERGAAPSLLGDPTTTDADIPTVDDVDVDSGDHTGSAARKNITATDNTLADNTPDDGSGLGHALQ